MMLEFNTNFPEYVSLNDRVIETKNASISVFDRGFIFGDGVYEGLLLINGVILFEDEHWKRLTRSLKALKINYNITQLKSTIKTYLAHEKVASRSAFLYIQITRGIAMRSHHYPENIAPTVFIYSINKTVTSINQAKLDTISAADTRWHRCDIKMTSLLGNIMAKSKAVEANCYEALLVRNNFITEASHCNIFLVKKGIVYTHPANDHILNGITRIKVIEICKELEIPCIEKAIHFDDILTMDEAFLTGTSTQVARIRTIDDHEFDLNKNEGITERIQSKYAQLKQDYIQNALK